MKIRNGFVSNSSSSSFVIAFKSDQELTLSDVEKALGIVPGTPIQKLFRPVLEDIIDGEKVTYDSLLDDYSYSGADTIEKLLEEEEGTMVGNQIKLLDEGFTVVQFSVDNNEAGLWFRMGNIDLPDVKFLSRDY